MKQAEIRMATLEEYEPMRVVNEVSLSGLTWYGVDSQWGIYIHAGE